MIRRFVNSDLCVRNSLNFFWINSLKQLSHSDKHSGKEVTALQRNSLVLLLFPLLPSCVCGILHRKRGERKSNRSSIFVVGEQWMGTATERSSLIWEQEVFLPFFVFGLFRFFLLLLVKKETCHYFFPKRKRQSILHMWGPWSRANRKLEGVVTLELGLWKNTWVWTMGQEDQNQQAGGKEGRRYGGKHHSYNNWKKEQRKFNFAVTKDSAEVKFCSYKIP